MSKQMQRAYEVRVDASGRRRRFVLPLLRDVMAAVLAHWESSHVHEREADEAERDGAWMDVRLVFGQWHVVTGKPMNVWVVNAGSSDYDTWHGLACGASSLDVTAKPTQTQARIVALDLLNQCADQLAELRS